MPGSAFPPGVGFSVPDLFWQLAGGAPSSQTSLNAGLSRSGALASSGPGGSALGHQSLYVQGITLQPTPQLSSSF